MMRRGGADFRSQRRPRSGLNQAAKWVPKTAVAANAAEYKQHVEGLVAGLIAKAAQLVGKENHKQRSEKGKAISQLRADPFYIDACRVAKGLAPAHGHFTVGAPVASEPEIDPQETARVAAETESALAELSPPQKEPAHSNDALDEEALEQAWSQRLAKLEAKMTQPPEVPPVGPNDLDELEAIAQEIVSYKLKLKAECGYRNKDLREDSRLQQLEERLDTLAGALIPAEEEEEPMGVDALRQWERRLTARLARFSRDTAGLSPSAAKEVGQLIHEITELKALLRSEGLTEHEQDRDERVLLRLIRLAELRQFQHHDKKRESRHKRELDTIREEMQQLEGRLETHKKKLHEELGLANADIKLETAVAELEERLTALCSVAGA